MASKASNVKAGLSLSPNAKKIELPVTNYWHNEAGETKKGEPYEASPHKFSAVISRFFIDRKKAKRYVLQYIDGNGELGECIIMPNHFILNQTLDTISPDDYDKVFEFVYQGKTLSGGQSGEMVNWLVGMVD